MKIGIDANSLTIGFQNGTRRYVQELVAKLSQLDKKNEYILFTSKKINIPNQSNFRQVILPNFPIFKRQIFLPLYINKENIDVFHNIDPYGSIFLKHSNIITTIHDIDLDAVYPKRQGLKSFVTKIYSKVTRYFVIKNSKAIVFDTKIIMNESKKTFGRLLNNKITKLIPLSQSSIFNRSSMQTKDGNFILCMGDFSPRKNIKNIFESYSLLPELYKKKYKLNLIVSTISESDRFVKLSKRYNLSKFIKIVISPSDNEVRHLYQSAICFLYPSLYEGFGLPILESMSSGCPVITSNYGSMKEVAGRAALLVDPRSPASISNAIMKVVNDKGTRNDLIKKGHARSSNFSWNKVAIETLSLYKSI